LLIGDSCTDEYYYGICERLSPEAPVPVLKITNHESKPGMVLNVEKNLRAFDCQTTVITNKEIIQKIRYIDIKSNQHLLRVDNDVCIDALELEKLKDLEKYDAIVISDYNKGFIEENIIIKIKEKYSCPIFIDTKKTDLQKFEGCIVKINSLEYEKIKRK
jgi:D-beta-D-heptose 7-phosphate kinase/D-beta-D-heptose 1-phosphate adenosyltransferase